jgi:SSS family solute:Na+ symporter
MGEYLNFIIVAVYMAAMIGIGFYSKRRATNESDFLVAGRRLGPVLYAGTMGALVMGGGATVGGIGLGYQFGISGMWLAFSLGFGVLVVSLTIASLVNRLKVYTVSQMLELRYGPGTAVISGFVMLGYAFMISVTSTIAYGTIFQVLFDLEKLPAVLLGGGIVVLYSFLGGMWSITLTDFVQFIIKTIGIFVLLLPAALIAAGGLDGLHAKLPESAFDLTARGWTTIFSYLIIYNLSIVIGQDVWQRIFTARSDKVAKWAGAAAGVYCFFYALAGALIGMSAKVLLPENVDRNTVYGMVVEQVLPVGLSGLVLAAALAAIMSVSSGTLIASATVAKQDIVRGLKHKAIKTEAEQRVESHDDVRNSRYYILFFGALMIAMAAALNDVVAAIAIGSAIVVTGLFIPIMGGILWKRANNTGTIASIVVGIIGTFGHMIYVQNPDSDISIFVGMGGGLIAYIVGTLVGKPTDPAVLAEWERRAKKPAA